MLASQELVDAVNRQIGNEFGASMQYVSIASYFDSQALNELARFFYRQADEEREHAMKFVKFIVDSDGRLAIPDVPAPKSEFSSAAEATPGDLWYQGFREVSQPRYQSRIELPAASTT